ncbi:cytochrome bd-I ubiquinol oxidase subunit 2 apoprotein [Marinilabilia salmonicolor]|jgi:cytochrome d ubiquinol oxidase subunit II|uniref:cytochrome d ubiquinol oxidase subunit II n=1 Tax=Marinilabilia salmonicolor TaxID=989 RepID=UPI000D053D3A|nr:cytochrome d ubiquinol oxidase subunit II [Marinilabilia salmonicolor]PRZ02083.1 cytochrome bd-I ubiquinol oxidase subunit 2 apoprotein [Marinilabilia salmonicolor]
MFEALSHLALQQYWWIIISVLGGALVFLMFVQGGQTLIYQVGKDKDERTMLINALGRKWEFTFTTLVTFGGAFFASFPLFYSTSFGGAYWAWMVLLFAFIIQAVSYEFRSRPGNVFGARTYETFLFINGLVGTFLLGVVVASFFTGSQFSLSDMNEMSWHSPFRGLELLLNVHNLTLGIAVFFLARTLGLLYFLNSIEDENIEKRIRKQLWYNAVPFLVFFLTFIIWLMFREGYALNPETGEIFMQDNKYFLNLIQMPVVLILFLAAVVLVLYGVFISLFKKSSAGIWFTGSGSFLAVFSLFLVAGFNNTAFYPSTIDMQSSLTIMKASSSHFTLTVMSYVSLMVPFVAAYIWFTWRAINKKKISKDELSSGESHFY